jgi:hypothetical protein
VLERLTVDDFAPWVGQLFELRDGETAIEAELAWARAVGERPDPGSPRRWTFSLGFRTPPEVRLPQRIYGVLHPELGRLDLFLVPVQPDAQGNLYEAVFN